MPSAQADGFNIVKVSTGTKPFSVRDQFLQRLRKTNLDNEEPRDGLWRGSYEESATAFTVPENGLYHVIIDNANELDLPLPV
ncbi:MAG: hypothetical protein R2751_03905 [Bacteroidales bacterium]